MSFEKYCNSYANNNEIHTKKIQNILLTANLTYVMSLQYEHFLNAALHRDQVLSERILKTFKNFHKRPGCSF